MTAFDTMKVFGVYLVVLGATGMIAPNLVAGAIGLPSSHDVWSRVAAMLVFNLGLLYVWIIRTRATAMIRFTVVTRLLVLGFLIAFVMAGLAPINLIVFGVVDAAGGLWTEGALRRDERALAQGARLAPELIP